MATLKVFIVSLAVLFLMSGVLSRKARKGKYDEDPKQDEGDEVWLIFQGDIGSRENYLDPVSGMKKGFEVDILNAVCDIAEKDCRIVSDVFQNCWDNVDGTPVGGKGLFNFYYDACMGYNPTYTRARTFQFSKSFTSNRGSAFIVPSGNPGNFEWTDISGKKIGLITGLVSDAPCILRASDTITGGDIAEFVYYDGFADLEAGIRSREVDAGFTSVDYPAGIEVASDPVYCALGGNAMMTRKDSKLADWFDPAFDELLSSGKYKKICGNLLVKHGALPGPDPKDICLV